MFADLHLHSCFSDGTQTPQEIACLARSAGMGLIALADHNTSAGWPELMEACRDQGIRCIRGMEMDCLYLPWEIHILAYGFEPREELMALADRSRQLLLDMSDHLIERLLFDYPQLSLEEYKAFCWDPRSGGWKGLHYLHHKGVTATVEDGMRLYAQYGCDYRDYPFPQAEEVCAAIRAAGGSAVLAHPCNWFAPSCPRELYRHLDALRERGIQGIECYYPANTPDMTRLCVDYCHSRHLLITAGSDSHGGFGKNHHGVRYYLGAVRIPETQLVLGSLAGPGDLSQL